MYYRTLPYIIFRDYPDYGYLTDNRNFGYDTDSKSSKKVGELFVSKTGSVMYSHLSSKPKDLDSLVEELIECFAGVKEESLKRDANDFYETLAKEGFILRGENQEQILHPSLWFSYQNYETFAIEQPQKTDFSSLGKVFGSNPQLTRVHLDVSSYCNEHCVHCYIPSSKKKGMMTKEMFDDIIEQCRSMHVLNITISGGEPMANPHLLYFLRKGRALNFSINLLSNLTLLSDEVIEEIASNPLVSVQTSLYSLEEQVHDSITGVKGSFNKTFNSILKLHERDVPLQVNCPIIKQNLRGYQRVLRWAKSLNIEATADYTLYGCYDHSCSNLSCRIEFNDIKKIEEERYEDIGKLREAVHLSKEKQVHSYNYICSVCQDSLCISNIGDVYPCEGWQGFTLGNINATSLNAIWNESPKVIGLRNLKYKNFIKCNTCEDKGYCTPCLIMNANENPNGDYMIVNPYMCSIAHIKKSAIMEKILYVQSMYQNKNKQL